MKTIIVDDEPQSIHLLQELLSTHHPEVTVLATGDCVQKGTALVNKLHPDLIFLDIEMPDGSGFDLLKKVNGQLPHVIFITAHNEYAITAIKFGALDYLLKPIGKNELTEAIKKAVDRQQEQITYEQLLILRETLQNLELNKLPTRIAFSTSDGIHYKLVDDIMHMKAEANYTKITFDGSEKPLLTSKNIGEYEDQFKRYKQIRRCHRSYIVNLLYVDTYVRKDGGYLIMKDGEKIPVSKGFGGGLDEVLASI